MRGLELGDIFAGDLECATEGLPDAYLCGIVNIYDEKTFVYFDNISEYLDYLFELPHRSIIYFHNLKYDYSYIYPECHARGIKISETITGIDRKIRKVRIYQGKKYVELRDSSPLFAPASIPLKKVMGAWCKKHTVKDSPTFYKTRPSVVSQEFFDYFREDIFGLAEALCNRFSLFPEQKTRLTTSSECKDMAKRIINQHFSHNKNFFDNVAFPAITLEQDAALRKYYRGGFVWINPSYRNKVLDNIYVFDVNSMYPSIMEGEILPYGKPRFFEGKPRKNPNFPLFVVKIVIEWAELKEGAPAFISNGKKSVYGSTEYVSYIAGSESISSRTLYLTNKELEYFLKYYDVGNIEYVEGYYFKGRKDIFLPYIEKFRDLKEKSTGAMREYAKLALNSPSGKWGQNPNIVQWESSTDIDGVQRFIAKKTEEKGKPFYLPTSIFITSYARMRLVNQIVKCGIENCVYTDTDSLHTIGDMSSNFDIHPTRFGAWDHEKTCEKAKYIRQKRYCQVYNGKFHSTVAGIPERYLLQVCNNIDAFNEGLKVPCDRMRMQAGGMMMKKMLITL